MMQEQNLPIAFREPGQDRANTLLSFSRNDFSVQIGWGHGCGHSLPPGDKKTQATAQGPLLIAKAVVRYRDEPGAHIQGKCTSLIEPEERVLREIRCHILVPGEAAEVGEQWSETFAEELRKADFEGGLGHPGCGPGRRRGGKIGNHGEGWHIQGTREARKSDRAGRQLRTASRAPGGGYGGGQTESGERRSLRSRSSPSDCGG